MNNTPATSLSASETPKEPLAPTMFKLRFKRGNNCDCWILFYLRGDLTAAIKRGREHCDRMNYKFLLVEQALVDLDATEKASEL